jgi:hypothetical protein
LANTTWKPDETVIQTLRSTLQVPAAPRTTAFVISVEGRELVEMASFERNFLLSFPSLDDHASIYDHVFSCAVILGIVQFALEAQASAVFSRISQAYVQYISYRCSGRTHHQPISILGCGRCRNNTAQYTPPASHCSMNILTVNRKWLGSPSDTRASSLICPSTLPTSLCDSTCYLSHLLLLLRGASNTTTITSISTVPESPH